jgi:hypothetical protein
MKLRIRHVRLLVLFLSAQLLPVAAKSAEFQHNPVKIECASKNRAFLAATNYAIKSGGRLILTTGTPSMEPLIHGKTYAVIVQQPYGAIAESNILVYRGRLNASKPDLSTVLHRAVLHDRYGWIMSGDNNRWSESWDRVTSDNYIGTVVALFAYPQT